MELNQYQASAMRTMNPKVREPLLEGLMGLNGEAGEAIEIIKKNMFQGHELDHDKIAEEIGDCLWYLSECAHAIGKSLDDIAEENLNKLKTRYPDGFSEEASVFRNENMPKPDGYLSIQEFYNLIVKCHGTYKGVPNYNTILKDCKSGKYIGAYQTGKMRKWMIPYFRTYHGYVEIGTYKFDQTYFS